MPSKNLNKVLDSKTTPPLESSQGGGFFFCNFYSNICRSATKFFLGMILGIWDICVKNFDTLSVSGRKMGRVKIKKVEKSHFFAKMSKFRLKKNFFLMLFFFIP